MNNNDIVDLIDALKELRKTVDGMTEVLKPEIPDPDEYTDLLNRALEKWGYDSQALIWIEELSELIKVIAKRDRKINPSYDEQLLNEIADVDICLDQIKILYPGYQEYKLKKVERLRRLVYYG